MKTGGFIACVAAAVSLFAFLGQPVANAQAGQSGARRNSIAKRMERLAKALDLTEEQKTKIKSILQNEKSQIKSVQEDTSLSAEQKQAKLEEDRKAARADMRAVLTPEQQKKLAAIKARIKAAHEKHREQTGRLHS